MKAKYEAARAEYKKAKEHLKVCNDAMQKAFSDMCEAEYGFAEGDIVEYTDRKGKAVRGQFKGWKCSGGSLNTYMETPGMWLIKNDGTVGQTSRLLYDLKHVRLVQKKPAAESE